MKRLLLLALLLTFLLFPIEGYCQVTVANVDLQINTIDATTINFEVNLTREDVDDIASDDQRKADNNFFYLRTASNDSIIYESELGDIGFGLDHLDFRILLDDDKKALIDLIHKGEITVYIELSKDLPVVFTDSSTFVLTRESLIELSQTAFHLSDKQKEELLAAAGGELLLAANHFDIARAVAEEDSTKSEYVATFDYTKILPLSVGNTNLALRVKGTISTEVANPLNKIEFYALWKIKTINLNLEIGRIGAQDFSTNALRGNALFEMLIPNLVDLTNRAPRLRLRPYLKLGASFVKYYEQDNLFGDDDFHLEVFGTVYYHIPVAEQFALLLEAEASWSDSFVRGNKVRFNYNLGFGYDLPLQDLKALIKIQGGENDINFESDTRVLAGLLLNLSTLER